MGDILAAVYSFDWVKLFQILFVLGILLWLLPGRSGPSIRDIGAGLAESQRKAIVPPLPVGALQVPIGSSASHLVRSCEQDILGHINPVSEPDRTTLLARLLAEERVKFFFWQLYADILTGQIAALRRLNAAAQTPISTVRQIFDAELRKAKDIYKPIGFQGWLDFLVRQRLVKQADKELEITDLGRDFLLFLHEERLSEVKAF